MGDRMTAPEVGDRVRIERDETRHPSRGTWAQFRGRTGTIIEINTDTKRPHLTEYGVVFGATRRRPDGSLTGHAVTWFKSEEMCALAPERHPQRGRSAPVGDSAQRDYDLAATDE
jgi:hypothetical protein